ncbi:RHS repeat domain-containing protein [Akkermansia glycaniphila]|uniref:Rhs protein signature n=1 Tax=Akkermansia glycaniphila TaxID=1679444 RepID=A0A1C7PFS2_9BACT|nr:RHS repeat-associated core domain-containing protein [Akkermansia glycaniphila]OCA04239.1 hypothetical protein AC781_00685 [Akkermansia glycaniphila]SEH96883.1 rhs protein signature [Akkermansia glycaniphila]
MILQQHYLYRGYQQIAALDLMRSNVPALWYLHWDPTQPVATRPLSLRKNGTWYTYGHDLTKNVTELYKADGTIATAYDYTPYGSVTATGIDQPIQWSSEHYDPELAFVYYNYRHYNPLDGRWINRDPIAEKGGRNLYGFARNRIMDLFDFLGTEEGDSVIKECTIMLIWGHGNQVLDWVDQEWIYYNSESCKFGLLGCQIKLPQTRSDFQIPNFPDVSRGNIGVADTSKNAGLNPNRGRISGDVRQGFANLLAKARQTANAEARRLCECTSCTKITMKFIAVGDRARSDDENNLPNRVMGTTEQGKWNRFMTWEIRCPQKPAPFDENKVAFDV